MRDTNLILRSAGALTAGTETGAWLDVQGLPAEGGIDMYVVVPTSTAGGTLDITVQDGTGAVGGESAVDTIYTFKQIASSASAIQLFHARIMTRRRHIRYVAVAATQDFGVVLIWLAAGPFKVAGE